MDPDHVIGMLGIRRLEIGIGGEDHPGCIDVPEPQETDSNEHRHFQSYVDHTRTRFFSSFACSVAWASLPVVWLLTDNNTEGASAMCVSSPPWSTHTHTHTLRVFEDPNNFSPISPLCIYTHVFRLFSFFPTTHSSPKKVKCHHASDAKQRAERMIDTSAEAEIVSDIRFFSFVLVSRLLVEHCYCTRWECRWRCESTSEITGHRLWSPKQSGAVWKVLPRTIQTNCSNRLLSIPEFLSSAT